MAVKPINEKALAAAVMRQCKLYFSGEKALCWCAKTGDMTRCQFSVNRMRMVIETYLTEDSP